MEKFFIRKVTSDMLLNMACFNGEETCIELGFGCEFNSLSLSYSKDDDVLSIYYGRSSIMGDTVYRLFDKIRLHYGLYYDESYNPIQLSEIINNKILQFLFDELIQTEVVDGEKLIKMTTIKETDDGYEFECEPPKIDLDKLFDEIN